MAVLLVTGAHAVGKTTAMDRLMYNAYNTGRLQVW